MWSSYWTRSFTVYNRPETPEKLWVVLYHVPSHQPTIMRRKVQRWSGNVFWSFWVPADELRRFGDVQPDDFGMYAITGRENELSGKERKFSIAPVNRGSFVAAFQKALATIDAHPVAPGKSIRFVRETDNEAWRKITGDS